MEHRTILYELTNAHIRDCEQAAAHDAECQLARLAATSSAWRRKLGRWLITAGERIQGSTLIGLPPISTVREHG